MKSILSLVLICFSCVYMSAQKPYSIYELSGQIRIKENKSQQWTPAHKNQAVSGLDSVEISKKGFVRIIDARTNQIFRSTVTGKTRVLNIINDAKKQSSGTIRRLVNELYASANTQSKAPTMQVVGATTRALEDDSVLEDSIVATFAYVAQQALQNNLNGSDEVRLNPNKKGEEISFSISNNSEKGYCVNVLRINKAEQTVSLCYILAEELLESKDLPCLYLPQKESIDLSSVLFADNPNEIYVLVATEDLYRTESVAFALKEMSLTAPIELKYKKYVVGTLNKK